MPSNSSYKDSDEDFEQTVLPPSDSDEPCSNVSFNQLIMQQKVLVVKWRKYPSSGVGRPKARDIPKESGPSNYIPTSIASPKDTFDLTFPTELIHKVLEFGNQRYQHFCEQYPQSSADNRFHGYQLFTIDEILAFIGLQFISGTNKMESQSLLDLFTSLQLPHFRAAISCDRLKLIFKFCRFDDSLTREQRKVQDRFCHIRKVWDNLISEAINFYNLGPYGTIDEMLLKFRGRCSFSQYMPSKPGRYSIKFWILADAQNHYCYNAMPYLGKNRDKVTVNLGSMAVKKLVESLHNSGRNITCGRYFMGIEKIDIDQKVRHYTTYHKTKHWPMAVFYNILGMTAYNAYVLFKLRPPSTDFNLNHIACYRFLMMLGETMMKPNVVTRSQLATGLNLSTKMAFQAFNLEVKPQANQRKIAKEEVKKGRCHVGLRKKDRKSRQKCSECKLNVCDEHSRKSSTVCLLCSE